MYTENTRRFPPGYVMFGGKPLHHYDQSAKGLSHHLTHLNPLKVRL